MNDRTPQAVQACHELIRWLIPQLDKLPRLRRFTLGERLERVLLDVPECRVSRADTRHSWRSPKRTSKGAVRNR